VPTGKVKWYDAEKGFGFLSQESGPDVYVHAEALPEGVKELKNGARVEFGIAQGRRGEQALQVRILEAPASVSRNQRTSQRNSQRKKPDDLATIVEDLIGLLDSVGEGYRHGRHPDPANAKITAKLLRALADELEL
jgi:CspA family cold shock protein